MDCRQIGSTRWCCADWRSARNGAYLSVVARLAAHLPLQPDRLDGAQVKAWLLHRITERHLACTTVNQAVCALKFFFDTVLGRRGQTITIPLRTHAAASAEILSREELARLFEAATNLRARTLLMTAYAAGLRVSEVCALRVADIDSAPDRMCIRVVAGKGGKDRYTLLSPSLLEGCASIGASANPRMAVPSRHRRRPAVRHQQCATCVLPCPRPGWYHQDGRHPHAAPRLRHPSARGRRRSGHAREALGHGHLSTTQRYLHLARPGSVAHDSPLDLLRRL